jgi:hypothetical protein
MQNDIIVGCYKHSRAQQDVQNKRPEGAGKGEGVVSTLKTTPLIISTLISQDPFPWKPPPFQLLASTLQARQMY